MKRLKKNSDDEETVAVVSADDGDDSTKEAESIISINARDGITVKGSEKLLKRIEQLSEEIEEAAEKGNGYNYKAEDTWGDVLEDVLVPIVLFGCVFGFAAFTIYSKQRSKKEYLETIRTLAQNNQPIPPELLASMNASSDFGLKKLNNNPSSIQGVKYLFIGLGVGGFLILTDIGSIGTALGFIFLVVGGYHIVKSQMLQKQAEAKGAAATNPPTQPTPPTATATNPEVIPPTTPSNP